jgi:hypothetical protein
MENGSTATAARMPRTLLAEMASPSPVPPNSTARSISPRGNGLGDLDADDRVCGLVAGVRDAEVADLSDPRPYITITASDP